MSCLDKDLALLLPLRTSASWLPSLSLCLRIGLTLGLNVAVTVVANLRNTMVSWYF